MEQKSFHYDGSIQMDYDKGEEQRADVPFEMTEEMRKNIGRNPYSLDAND